MSDQDDDQLFALDEAASTLLRGLVKAATLRNAITRGELAHTRLGRRILVTKRDIEQWRAACRVEARKAPAYGSNLSERPLQERPSAPSGASSTTEESNGAPDALSMIVQRLKIASPPTSGKRGSRRENATVLHLR